jgi:hypothetical protein
MGRKPRWKGGAVMSITRRLFLHNSAAVSALAASGVDVAKSAATAESSKIEELYGEWLALESVPYPDTEDGDAERFARYCDLQARIIAQRPVTARELAIIYYVDSDCMGSDNSTVFDSLITEMVRS